MPPGTYCNERGEHQYTKNLQQKQGCRVFMLCEKLMLHEYAKDAGLCLLHAAAHLGHDLSGRGRVEGEVLNNRVV